jgi:AraC-like DNA-binding protein
MVKFGSHAPTSGAAMRVSFSTDDIPPRDREQFWFDVVAKQWMRITLSDRPDSATFRGRWDAQLAGRFTLVDFEVGDRTGGRMAADAGRDETGKFRLHRVRREQVYTADPTRARPVEVWLAPGDFFVSSGELPSRVTMKDGASVSGLLILHKVLSPLLAGGHLTRPIPVRATSPIGPLLGAAFDAAATQLPLLTPELGDAALQNLCGLVALACGASEEGRSSWRDGVRAARLEETRRYIEQHLGEPDLTPASTAAALGISVRHLHLLFERTGTSFSQYVARSRLLRCRTTLTSPAGARRSVADIAFRWGFNSLATFYRAFEREFGLSPAALRAAAAAGYGD